MGREIVAREKNFLQITMKKQTTSPWLWDNTGVDMLQPRDTNPPDPGKEAQREPPKIGEKWKKLEESS